MLQNSPHTIALNRGIETGLIVLGSALLVVLPLIVTSLTPCSALPAPGQPVPSCAVPWNVVFNAFVIATISGIVNALTAFVSALHANAQNAQVVVQTPLAGGPGEAVVNTPVKETTPVTVLDHPIPPVPVVPVAAPAAESPGP